MSVYVIESVLSIIASIILIYYVKKYSKKVIIESYFGYIVCFIVALFIAFGITSIIPEKTESVTITALDQKNEKAENTEIYLTGVFVNGKKVKLDVDKEHGQWFWQGNWYVWRNEADIRKPTGITESFILDIPIGKERRIEFYTNTYKGKVLVDYNGNSDIIDCYSSKNGRISSFIKDTSYSDIIKQNIFSILLFITTYILCTFLLVSNYKRIINIIVKHKELSILTCLVIVVDIITFKYAKLQSFWGDEIHQIKWSDPLSSLAEIVAHNTHLSDVNPPLYAILLSQYRKFIPYGQEWLLLFNIIAVSIGVYCIYYAMSSKNKKIGVFAAAITLVNPSLYNYAVFELRSYSLFFMISCFLMLLLSLKNKMSIVRYNFCMFLCCVALAYSHVFGVLMVSFLGVFELYQVLRKKISWMRLVPYIFSGICFFPYAIIVLVNMINGETVVTISNAGAKTADLRNIYHVFQFLSGESLIIMMLMVFGIVAYYSYSISNKEKNNISLNNEQDLIKYCLVLIGSLVIIPFCLSVLAQTSYMKLRYYICLLPFISVIMAYGIFYLSKHSECVKYISWHVAGVCFIVCMLFRANYIVQGEQLKIYQPFREVAGYLTSQADYYSSNVVVLLCGRDPMRFGWEYYLFEGGKRQEREVLSWNNKKDRDRLEAYNKIYVYYPYSLPNGVIKYFNDKNFKQVKNDKKMRLIVFEKLTKNGE